MPKKKIEEDTAIEETNLEATTEEAVVEADENVENKEASEVKAEAPKAQQKESVKDGERGNRATRVGVVTSDKMDKTVVVRVDRLIKHPKYRKYVRRRKKFMAHDDLASSIGDKVKIVETRPLSARKRWRVVAIIQKAAK